MLNWTQLECWYENPDLPYVAWKRTAETRRRNITIYLYGPLRGRNPILPKHILLGYRGYSFRVEEGLHKTGFMVYARTMAQAMSIVNSDLRKGILL
ncbi:hypothetical protein UFOVP1492_2 [uncultured Caudovirales phage]|uniref:Uncharacterized protein n=1 Tax=uncultured Caudovirales phage TaxID=2100421 RepID=A0A6J5QPN6_9CAUD|nr:hypothetical protein UFOVP1127_132 [uncultured Caudovirales phage]CAB4193433.1 hypothetical protein UFOVP1242_78 [uncultured Caudovirales phage]CAB4216956.1 hypothetical protein UFOVP1492_2 [uncultured Caudovirales phage]CAB5231186.1 hypothetical protein UFOVP1580_31 [uncultured Caudovirales phage]